MNSLHLNHTTPAVAYDGVNVVTKNDGSARLFFFQYREEGQQSEADVVASVSIVNETEWEKLRDLVDGEFAKSKKIEP